MALVAYAREANLHAQADRLSGEIQRAYGDVTQLRAEAAGLQTETHTAEEELRQAKGRTATLEHDFGELETQRQALASTLEVRQQKLYATLLYLAQADWEAGEVLRADAYLEDCPTELRDRRWSRLKHLCHPAMRSFAGTRCLAISSDGQLLASVRARMVGWEIVVADFGTQQIVHSIPCPAAMEALLFSPDGTTLISGGADAAVHLWDVKSGELRQSLTGHTGPVTCLSLTADGRLLASASLLRVRHGADRGRSPVVEPADRRNAAEIAGAGSSRASIRPESESPIVRATPVKTTALPRPGTS